MTVANPVAFVYAPEIGVAAMADPESIDGDERLLALLEFVRREAAVRIGLAQSHERLSID
jgi:2-methylaconitate cis-trans-isomerase PrpF